MGLSLVTISNGDRTSRFEVGSYEFFNHLRAALVLLFVRAAWQIEDLCDTERDGVQNILGWLDLEAHGIDVWETEVCEEDIDRVLHNTKPIYIYRDHIPGCNLGMQQIVMGSDLHIAAIGLWKLVTHSECDGFLSPGDVADVAAMFRLIKCPGTIPEHEAITVLSEFFTSAAEQHLMVLFA